MTVHFHPDRRGIEALLKSVAIAAVVKDAADQVADAVRSQGVAVEGIPGDVPLPVEVMPFEADDTAAAWVILAHPSGIAVQAKDGALSKAAASVGLEIH